MKISTSNYKPFPLNDDSTLSNLVEKSFISPAIPHSYSSFWMKLDSFHIFDNKQIIHFLNCQYVQNKMKSIKNKKSNHLWPKINVRFKYKIRYAEE